MNPFVDVALTFFDNEYDSYLCDIKIFCLLSKSVFFTELVISFLLDKSASFSLAVKVL